MRRAGSAVELALVLPVLAALGLGAVDFGRLAATSVAVANAAGAGAGFAAQQPCTPATLDLWRTAVRQAVLDDLGSANEVEVLALVVTDADGSSHVEVTVSRPYTTLFCWPGMPARIVISRTASLPAVRP